MGSINQTVTLYWRLTMLKSTDRQPELIPQMREVVYRNH